MATIRRIGWGAGLLALTLAGCLDKYVPDVANPTASYLVVDGFINGNGRTRISLSRTESVAATTTPPAEKGAKLFIQDDAGQRYALTETATGGAYQSDSLVLSPARRYQLGITTAGAHPAVYASDPVAMLVTPPFDNLNWRLNDDQVLLQVSTHDPSGSAQYFRWRFVETWEFNAAFESHLEYYAQPKPGQKQIDNRTTPIYTCWRTEQPSLIAQGTSAQLSQPALVNYVVRSFSARDERVKVRYSVLVSQYAESAAEFAYYELLRKNTEAVGTVNDPLPVQLTGNVHRTDASPGEPVLGYVGAHTAQTRRLFIDHRDLPTRSAQDYTTPYTSCQASVSYFCDPFGQCNPQAVYDLFKSPDSVPLDYVSDPTSGLGISSATADCADCRRRGSNVKPSFW